MRVRGDQQCSLTITCERRQIPLPRGVTPEMMPVKPHIIFIFVALAALFFHNTRDRTRRVLVSVYSCALLSMMPLIRA